MLLIQGLEGEIRGPGDRLRLGCKFEWVAYIQNYDFLTGIEFLFQVLRSDTRNPQAVQKSPAWKSSPQCRFCFRFKIFVPKSSSVGYCDEN